MTPFTRHNITHLSASSLNTWREAPGLWALRYLSKVRDDGNPAMWRGSAVEAGLHRVLVGRPDEALPAALDNYALNSHGEITDEIESERALIEPMIAQASRWQAPSPLVAVQLKIEHWFEGIGIPVIGYADFIFEDGLIVDLKTTAAMPSTPRANHVRQVALYRAARGNAPGAVLYATKAKHACYPIDDENMDRALNDLESDARSLMAFLACVNSPADAIRCLPMNTDHYTFSNPKMKVALADILAAG